MPLSARQSPLAGRDAAGRGMTETDFAKRDPGNPDPAGFGVYVHWPFCASKCPYCDFNSHVRAGGVDQADYLEAYRREIADAAARTGPRKVASIFFGGGTPSLMAPATVSGILDAIANAWHIAAEAEITLEANPSSVEADRFEAYRSAGINRVSLGVQSLVDADLVALGRLHTAAEALGAIDIAANTFERISFDLIYARPRQTEAEWEAELARALAVAPGHISLYQLTIEAGTPFAALYDRGRLAIPAAREADALFRLTQDLTAAHGLAAYEISNHATPGQACRHNLLYWRYGEYAGIGPGAHGRIISAGTRLATSTERRPEAWRLAVGQRGHGLVEIEPLSQAEQADEALMMGLRLTEGLDVGRLAALAGLAPDPAIVGRLVADGLLAEEAGRLEAVGDGRFVLNELILQLSASLRPIGSV
jgi:oxygen-independent coproporphyrinogen-3 oxidase